MRSALDSAYDRRTRYMCRALVFEECLRSYVTQRENIRCDVYSARWTKEQGIYMCSAHMIHKGGIFGAKD